MTVTLWILSAIALVVALFVVAVTRLRRIKPHDCASELRHFHAREDARRLKQTTHGQLRYHRSDTPAARRKHWSQER